MCEEVDFLIIRDSHQREILFNFAEFCELFRHDVRALFRPLSITDFVPEMKFLICAETTLLQTSTGLHVINIELSAHGTFI